MQAASTQIHVPLTSTCFDLDAYEFNANPAEYPPTLALTPQSATPKALPVSDPALQAINLSLQPPQKRLENWRLVLLQGGVTHFKPQQIIGAAVQIAQGRTSPITGFDPLTRRVRTRSGSVYELGVPQMAFERMAPEVMRSLGF